MERNTKCSRRQAMCAKPAYHELLQEIFQFATRVDAREFRDALLKNHLEYQDLNSLRRDVALRESLIFGAALSTQQFELLTMHLPAFHMLMAITDFERVLMLYVLLSYKHNYFIACLFLNVLGARHESDLREMYLALILDPLPKPRHIPIGDLVSDIL